MTNNQIFFLIILPLALAAVAIIYGETLIRMGYGMGEYDQTDRSGNLPLSEQFRRAGEEWADANAAATLLEDTKSAVLAERIQAHTDLPYNRAEALVKSSPEWREHIEKTVAARKRANRLKVQMEYIHIKCWEQNSREATARTEMRMTV